MTATLHSLDMEEVTMMTTMMMDMTGLEVTETEIETSEREGGEADQENHQGMSKRMMNMATTKMIGRIMTTTRITKTHGIDNPRSFQVLLAYIWLWISLTLLPML